MGEETAYPAPLAAPKQEKRESGYWELVPSTFTPNATIISHATRLHTKSKACARPFWRFQWKITLITPKALVEIDFLGLVHLVILKTQICGMPLHAPSKGSKPCLRMKYWCCRICGQAFWAPWCHCDKHSSKLTASVLQPLHLWNHRWSICLVGCKCSWKNIKSRGGTCDLNCVSDSLQQACSSEVPSSLAKCHSCTTRQPDREKNIGHVRLLVRHIDLLLFSRLSVHVRSVCSYGYSGFHHSWWKVWFSAMAAIYAAVILLRTNAEKLSSLVAPNEMKNHQCH